MFVTGAVAFVRGGKTLSQCLSV